MTEPEKLQSLLHSLEGRESLLYSDDRNPYESIYIRAKIKNGLLTVEDSECEHGPDGGWSFRILAFDAENTKKALALLTEQNKDPFQGLKNMLSYTERTSAFRRACKERGISYKNTLSF